MKNFIIRIGVVGRQGFDEVGDRYKNMGPRFTTTSYQSHYMFALKKCN